MRNLRRFGRGLAVVSALIAGVGLVGAIAVWLLVPPVRATIREDLLGQTPQAEVEAFVRAVGSGDALAAETVWELPEHELRDGRSAALAERRERTIRQLIEMGIRDEIVVVDVAWWRTCCEPAVIDDARSAGGARIRVDLRDRAGERHRYVFDVFSREGAYWGAATGYPPRDWVLRDVYPPSQEPIFWPFVERSD